MSGLCSISSTPAPVVFSGWSRPSAKKIFPIALWLLPLGGYIGTGEYLNNELKQDRLRLREVYHVEDPTDQQGGGVGMCVQADPNASAEAKQAFSKTVSQNTPQSGDVYVLNKAAAYEVPEIRKDGGYVFRQATREEKKLMAKIKKERENPVLTGYLSMKNLITSGQFSIGEIRNCMNNHPETWEVSGLYFLLLALLGIRRKLKANHIKKTLKL